MVMLTILEMIMVNALVDTGVKYLLEHSLLHDILGHADERQMVSVVTTSVCNADGFQGSTPMLSMENLVHVQP